MRVIEMGSLLAGPFCGQLLGDFGAEVIKLEPPGAGDPMRQWGREKPHGLSLWWPIVARNKKSVTCNLRTEQGQDLARRMIATADFAVENFRPGTMERWGLNYERLAEMNRRLILIRVTGFGQTGPYASRAGYGSIGEAMGGLRYTTGDPSRPPSRTGISIGDSLAGTFAAFGGLAASHARERSDYDSAAEWAGALVADKTDHALAVLYAEGHRIDPDTADALASEVWLKLADRADNEGRTPVEFLETRGDDGAAASRAESASPCRAAWTAPARAASCNSAPLTATRIEADTAATITRNETDAITRAPSATGPPRS